MRYTTITIQHVCPPVARRFAQVLRRQTSLNHLCQAARSVIHSSDITLQMLDDWLSVDLSSIVKQTLYTMDHYSEREHETIFNCRLTILTDLHSSLVGLGIPHLNNTVSRLFNTEPYNHTYDLNVIKLDFPLTFHKNAE